MAVTVESTLGGKLTWNDYLDFAEDGRRHEIVDGEHYVTASPALTHQRASKHVHFQLYEQIERQGKGEVLRRAHCGAALRFRRRGARSAGGVGTPRWTTEGNPGCGASRPGGGDPVAVVPAARSQYQAGSVSAGRGARVMDRRSRGAGGREVSPSGKPACACRRVRRADRVRRAARRRGRSERRMESAVAPA